MESLHEVTFLPSGKKVSVPDGTLLLEAAARAGIVLDTPCGGQGRCGRCRVKVERGEVSFRENPRLTPKQIDEGWVLACTSKVWGDLVISVPAKVEREKVVLETADTRVETPIVCGFLFSPAVQRILVRVPPPSLGDPVNDLERLKRVIAARHGIDDLQIELPVLQRLAGALRQGNWEVTAVINRVKNSNHAELIGVYPGSKKGPPFGVAVDIGTTNVVIDLIDLRTGRLLDRVSERNKQIVRGEDVISRIYFSEKGKGLQELQGLVIQTINLLLDELAQKHQIVTSDIEDMVVAGNTIMEHLFLGLPSRALREEPYVPTATDFPVVKARELGIKINENASIFCVPAVAAYVGGDTTAGVVASCLFKTDELTLFLDVGTNGEIVLGNADWMTTCACSAGPAFEGAGVQHGIRATTGAIEEVRINSKTLEPTIGVIGGVKPLGVCGSGMISAVAEMFITGVIDRGGKLNVDYVRRMMGDNSRVRQGEHRNEYVLVRAGESGTGRDIVLSEVDIDNLIRTKGAIYAGMAVMARSVGINLKDVSQVLIGGAFGRHISVEQAIMIGLLPDLPWEKFRYLGNTSASGAYNILISREAREKSKEVARKLTYLELIAEGSFMDELTASLFLPHTNLESFPTVKETLAKAGRLRD
ncbi:MAG: DUF4445 domain-containing protein [Chloroflexi bacterium]|nr:DUF4445 domain-containing protein [Chloroflexota bacterium]